jgi:hypothetical protein
MVILLIYLVIAIIIPTILYFTFGKEYGLDWGFGEVVVLMFLMPILSYLVFANLLIFGKAIKTR